MSESLNITSNKTIDLNGRTLTIKNSELDYGLTNNAKLTIKNGTINFEGNAANNGAAVINMAQIEMEDVTITSTSATCFRNYNKDGVADLAGKKVEDAVITANIEGCEFTSSYQNNESHSQHRYAVQGYGFSNMIMTDCAVTGWGGVAIDTSFATLNGVEATAGCTAGAHDLYVACGNATVTGCIFNNAAAYSDDKYGTAYVNGESYGNGTHNITNL